MLERESRKDRGNSNTDSSNMTRVRDGERQRGRNVWERGGWGS